MRETKELRDVLNFDKKFKGLQQRAIDKVLSFSHVSAETMKEMKIEGGDVRLLSVGQFEGFTTKDIASDNLCYGEVITIPTGGAANFKYHNGYFVDSGNILCSPKNVSINGKYVYYFLCKNVDLVDSMFQGAGIRHPKMSEICKIRIPICSYEEQCRIVAELELLTEIIDKQKQQLKELDTLAQSIFYNMFGNPVENDKGWEKKQIGKICASKKQIQRASKRFKDSDIIRYIDISSIDNINNVMTSTTSYGFGDAPSRAQQVVEIGDVLISLVRPNLNNVAMVSEDGTDLVASSGFCVLRANCEIVKEFLFYSVKMKCFTDYLMQRVSGANYPAVREDDIMGYNIILPPLELQESFAQKIQSIESQKESINRSLAESQKLFDYTMDKYFG